MFYSDEMLCSIVATSADNNITKMLLAFKGSASDSAGLSLTLCALQIYLLTYVGGHYGHPPWHLLVHELFKACRAAAVVPGRLAVCAINQQ